LKKDKEEWEKGRTSYLNFQGLFNQRSVWEFEAPYEDKPEKDAD